MNYVEPLNPVNSPREHNYPASVRGRIFSFFNLQPNFVHSGFQSNYSAERSAYPAKTSSFHCRGIAEFTAYKGNSKSPHFRREWGNKDLAVTMFRRGGCMYVFAPSSIRISDLCEVVRIQYRDNVEVAKFYEECSGT